MSKDARPPELVARPAPSSVVQSLMKHPQARWGIGGLGVVIALALLGPVATGYDPAAPDLAVRLSPPSWSHLMGTDQLGRDVLARLMAGARVSLLIALGSSILGLLVGVTLGSLGGYFGGWVDAAVMRTVDLVLAIPRLVLLIAVIAILRPDPATIVILLALTQWPTAARLIRAEVLRLREQEFVQAARALGYSHGRVLVRHILPNAMAPVLVAAMLGVSHMVILESGLAFLGLGVPLSWGTLLLAGKNTLLTGGWWLAVFPGVAVALLAVSFNLVGDGLRDVLDPRNQRWTR